MSTTAPAHQEAHEPAPAAPPIVHLRASPEPFRWDGVSVLKYKEDGGTHFHKITRQVLFEGDGIGAQWRYFEIEPGGHSTLEKHQHVHSVMIVRGQGQALVGEEILTLGAMDMVYVPPLTWHQFRANLDDHLGFLCLVACDRDRPQRADEAVIAELNRNKEVGAFIRT